MQFEVWIAGGSVIVALAAFWLSVRADARSRAAARTPLYLELRTRFLEVYAELPPRYSDPGWEPTSPEEEAAVMRYWHHTFDEWYMTNRLNEKHMRELWIKYYSSAILSGLKHRGLRKVLIKMTSRAEEFGIYWKDFRNKLTSMWKETHPGGSSECPGLECTTAHLQKAFF
jgi:hypothetical protein